MFRRKISLVLVCVLTVVMLAVGGMVFAATRTQQVATSTAQATTSGSTSGAATTSTGESRTAATVLADESKAHETNATTDIANAVQVTLNGDSITANGAGVQVVGSVATISAAGSYSISGTLNNGQIVVDAADATVQLILNNATISNATSAPIYIKSAAAAEIVLADATTNVLTDSDAYVYASADEDEPNAALFSDEDLTISGNGSLTVNGKYNDGIASKDGLVIASGTITVSAVDDGIRGKDYLVVKDGTLAVNAGGDGLKSDNDEDATKGYISIEKGTFNITAGGDGMQAETDLVVADGTVTIVAGGGSTGVIDEATSAKGLKGTASVTIDNGTFDINAADDALHSNQSIVVNNGTFAIATGDDAIHADTSVTINNGAVRINESYEGIEAITITINAGDINLTASDDGINAAGEATATQESVATFLPVVMSDSTTGTTAQQGPNQGGPGGPGQGGGNQHLYINGGSLVVNAGGDGLDSNGSITMTDGVVIVNGPTENMNGPLDYDGTFTQTGGFLVAAGSSGMASAPGDTSTQNALLLNFTSAQQAGTIVHIQNSAGEDILTFAPSKTFQSIAFSSSKLVTGETYTVYTGGSATGSVSNGLYSDTTYSAGTEYTTFTVSSVVTQIGTGNGGRGGRP